MPQADRGLKPVRTFAPRREVLNALDAGGWAGRQGDVRGATVHPCAARAARVRRLCSSNARRRRRTSARPAAASGGARPGARCARTTACHAPPPSPAVPFTPSQGICTPSPTQVMLVQQPMLFAECSPGWAPMVRRRRWLAAPAAARLHVQGEVLRAGSRRARLSPVATVALQGAAGSPRASSSSGQSESSAGGYGCAAEPSPTSTSSNPGTPYGRPLLFSSFYFPMPFSPRALQRAAQQGEAGGGEPHTPVRAHFGGGGGMAGDEAGSGGMPPGFGLYGSPLAGVQSPGQLVFTQFFAPDALDPAMSGELPDSPPDGSELSGGLGAGGSGALLDGDLIELTPAARQIAAAMCAAQNLQGPPPSQVGGLCGAGRAGGLGAHLLGGAGAASGASVQQA